MISIKRLKSSASNAAKYYEQEAQEFDSASGESLDGHANEGAENTQENPGAMLWHGRLKEVLGLSSEVKREDFESIYKVSLRGADF